MLKTTVWTSTREASLCTWNDPWPQETLKDTQVLGIVWVDLKDKTTLFSKALKASFFSITFGVLECVSYMSGCCNLNYLCFHFKDSIQSLHSQLRIHWRSLSLSCYPIWICLCGPSCLRLCVFESFLEACWWICLCVEVLWCAVQHAQICANAR